MVTLAVTSFAQASSKGEFKLLQSDFFRSPNKKEVIAVLQEKHPRSCCVDTTEYLSLDGKTFRRIDRGTYHSNGGDGLSTELFDFTVPGTSRRSGQLELKTKYFDVDKPDWIESITVDGKAYERINADPAKFQFLDFPNDRKLDTVLRTENGLYLVVTAPQYFVNSYYGNFRLFMGRSITDLTQVTITDRHFTQCGHFEITTAVGKLEYHTPDVQSKHPTLWGQDRAEELDAEQFELKEKGITARLVRKTK